MIQQVNLYQDAIRRTVNQTASNRYLAALVTFALLLTAVSLYTYWQTDRLKNRVQQIRHSINAQPFRTSDSKNRFPEQQGQALSASQLENLLTKVGGLSQALQLLAKISADATPGFSQPFQALAGQSIQDIKISRIQISASQRIASLEGHTSKPEMLAYFLQQLQKQPVLQGQTFTGLAVRKSEKIAGQIDFKFEGTTNFQRSGENDR